MSDFTRVLCGVLLGLFAIGGTGCIHLQAGPDEVRYELQVRSRALGTPLAGAAVTARVFLGKEQVDSQTLETDPEGRVVVQVRLPGHGFMQGSSLPRSLEVLISKEGFASRRWNPPLSGFIRERGSLWRSEGIELKGFDAVLLGAIEDRAAAIGPLGNLMQKQGWSARQTALEYHLGRSLGTPLENAQHEADVIVLLISASLASQPWIEELAPLFESGRLRESRVVAVVLGLEEDYVKSSLAFLEKCALRIRPYDPKRPLSEDALLPVLKAAKQAE